MSQETMEETPETTSTPDVSEDEVSLESLLRDYEDYLASGDSGRTIKLSSDDQDFWEIDLGDEGSVSAYTSEIDGDFYGDGRAVFLEAEVGPLDPQVDLARLLRFSGEQLVLSRISLVESDDGESSLVVEAACPFTQIEFEVFDLMVREVATIAAEVADMLESTGSSD